MNKNGPIGKVIMPGDPGYNNPKLPWGWVRNVAGLKKPDKVSLEVHGFFLMDRRRTPAVAIFKNMELLANSQVKAVMTVPLQPFQYLGEALAHREKMHLSADDEKMVVPVALCPDPGFENPQPDQMWIDPKEAKQR